MATRTTAHGLTAEVKSKIADKYDVNLERSARTWMEAVVKEKLSNQTLGPDGFHNSLKDGVFLCKLASAMGGSIKFNTSKMAFKQMENIGKFLEFCDGYGVAKSDSFQTVDLYEAQNMWQVVMCIHALGRKAQSKRFPGPVIS